MKYTLTVSLMIATLTAMAIPECEDEIHKQSDDFFNLSQPVVVSSHDAGVVTFKLNKTGERYVIYGHDKIDAIKSIEGKICPKLRVRRFKEKYRSLLLIDGCDLDSLAKRHSISWKNGHVFATSDDTSMTEIPQAETNWELWRKEIAESGGFSFIYAENETGRSYYSPANRMLKSMKDEGKIGNDILFVKATKMNVDGKNVVWVKFKFKLKYVTFQEKYGSRIKDFFQVDVHLPEGVDTNTVSVVVEDSFYMTVYRYHEKWHLFSHGKMGMCRYNSPGSYVESRGIDLESVMPHSFYFSSSSDCLILNTDMGGQYCWNMEKNNFQDITQDEKADYNQTPSYAPMNQYPTIQN